MRYERRSIQKKDYVKTSTKRKKLIDFQSNKKPNSYVFVLVEIFFKKKGLISDFDQVVKQVDLVFNIQFLPKAIAAGLNAPDGNIHQLGDLLRR